MNESLRSKARLVAAGVLGVPADDVALKQVADDVPGARDVAFPHGGPIDGRCHCSACLPVLEWEILAGCGCHWCWVRSDAEYAEAEALFHDDPAGADVARQTRNGGPEAETCTHQRERPPSLARGNLGNLRRQPPAIIDPGVAT